MASTLVQWIHYLDDPHLVAKFQRACGIRSSSSFDARSGIHSNHGVDNNAPNESDISSKSNGLVESSMVNGSDNTLKRRDHAHNNSTENNNNAGDTSVETKKAELQYSIDNKCLYWLFTFGAGLGNSTFYTLFFSVCVWSFDSFVLRKTLLMWIVIMYVGQVAKDIIKWPRPRSPPAIRLEERYGLEYGMPSTHAMVGFVLPFGMLFYMCGRYEFSLLLGLLIAVSWCLLVCSSRIYLGMHSALDVIAGVLFAAVLMSVTAPFVDPVDRFLISHPLSTPVLVMTCVALGLMYPRVEKWSTTRADTMLSLGVFSGIYQGLWLVRKMSDSRPAPETLPLSLSVPSHVDIGLLLLRQLIGVPFISLFAVVTKLIILHLFSWCLRCNPNDPETKRRLEIPYRYGGFFVAASVGLYLPQIIFSALNLDRGALLSETFS
ncbi:sphingosine-1-phosphate phosphatase 2-like isoform X2 [Biomphalaria pfeifferi]|uniref:Sphingosine-1-phosphate phosphatase 2-like isoform X2 n=1 Tax=Biomphalaria pfeifferi TaxID=112525 RepID=A0AAD8EWR0_BIOPF|nr:sphingosine-1-phosphate phosphatase 2-like isoform X2 [Biomphalaria pfeifferi]